MKRVWIVFAVVATLAAAAPLRAQNKGNGNGNGNGANDGVVFVPGSSVENPGDEGRRSHTNHLIFQRGQGKQSYLSGLTPANIRTAYNLTSDSTGAGVIAIVDAFHYPGASADLKTFSTAYTPGHILPACGPGGPALSGAPCFWQVYADLNNGYSSTTGVPPVNCGWNQEAALDIEWAHAMAPNASIVLVEAQSNSNSALFSAVKAASTLIGQTAGKGEVSMSWGGSETSGETALDAYFPPGNNIVYFASSGDTGGKVIYPGVSPNVVSAGGTTLNMISPGVFQSETGWSGSGGGASAYELAAAYQQPIASLLNGKRGVPDLSFDADPSTGVLVYGPTCSGSNTGLMIFGGTSVSAPSLAGIVNSAASFAAGSSTELGRLYGALADKTAYTGAKFRDITSGRAGKYNAATGWDFVTGIGSSLGLTGK